MAKAAKLASDTNSEKIDKKKLSPDEIDDLTGDLIKSINKEFGMRVAYNLSEDKAPTIVKRWIDTGSIQLNYAIRNLLTGGYPEGRVIEISGLPSSGKSHLAYHAAAVVQSMGGLVVYIDTENATPIDKLRHMGINVAKRFVYCDTHCTEEVFSIMESTVLKAKQITSLKDIPILVIWDSVAATSPKAELDGDYDQNTIGLQARVISKGMRKITGVIGQNNVTLICINQLREKIGVMHGDPLCVDPLTTIVNVRANCDTIMHKMIRAYSNTTYSDYSEYEISLANLANILCIDTSIPNVYDIDELGLEIMTPTGYKPVSTYVVKERSDAWKLGKLLATSEHRVLDETTKTWKSMIEMGADHLDKKIDVVDLEVPDGNCYIANGFVNHNTTPGGKAIPFHASLRIRLGSGSPIKDKSGNIIGIHVSVTVKKNKVAAPFRKCEFDIHFGKGIVEHEFIFDHVRSYCDKNQVFLENTDAKGNTKKVEIKISGVSSWKELVVSDPESGEVLLEKKFYKSDFGEMMKDPAYKIFIDKVIDDAYIVKSGESANEDGESSEEDNEDYDDTID